MATFVQRKLNAVTGTGTLRHFEDLQQVCVDNRFTQVAFDGSENRGGLPPVQLQANRDWYFYQVPVEQTALDVMPDMCRHTLDNRAVFSAFYPRN